MARSLSRAEFERIVEEALAELPPRFTEMIENVVITVEDEPSPEDLDALDDPDDELLGIYRGVALTERSHDDAPFVPDEIAVFRGPIARTTSSRAEAIEEVRTTVIHELGHYFGLGDDELP